MKYVFDVPTSKAGKRLNEGGTTPSLARKRKDDWRIYLHPIFRGFSHRYNRAIIILRTLQSLNVARHRQIIKASRYRNLLGFIFFLLTVHEPRQDCFFPALAYQKNKIHCANSIPNPPFCIPPLVHCHGLDNKAS